MNTSTTSAPTTSSFNGWLPSRIVTFNGWLPSR